MGMGGGPPPMAQADKSRFLNALDAQGFGAMWVSGGALRDPAVKLALGVAADPRPGALEQQRVHVDPAEEELPAGEVDPDDLRGEGGTELVRPGFEAPGLDLEAGGIDSRRIVTEIKQLEQSGYQFDVADGSFKVLIEKLTDNFQPLFVLESFRVTIEKDREQPCQAHATVKIRVGDRSYHTVAEATGPISALDRALRLALEKEFPQLAEMQLRDYKVRILESNQGAGSRTRVLVESGDGHAVWGTVGVSDNIVDASWEALREAVVYKLLSLPKTGA
jgi:hypothetical protein